MLTTDEADISVNCHFVNSQKKVRRRLCEKMASEKRGGDVAYSPLNDNSNPSDGEDSSSDIRMDDRGGTSRFKMLILVRLRSHCYEVFSIILNQFSKSDLPLNDVRHKKIRILVPLFWICLC